MSTNKVKKLIKNLCILKLIYTFAPQTRFNNTLNYTIMTTKTITFGTRLNKDGHHFTCRELIILSPNTILNAMTFDNRFILDDDVRECLSSQKNNKDIFEKIIKINDKRVQMKRESSDYKVVISSSDLSMGNGITINNIAFTGVRYGGY